MLSAALPVTLPEVVAVGRPGFGYPERWAVTRWIEGDHPVSAAAGEMSCGGTEVAR